ncbi:MAG TPA: hypothetical protein VHN80_27940 [Kineosporiaceae bacterium]|nr:hypothetical protein [Kineosporiaceae bacterium]
MDPERTLAAYERAWQQPDEEEKVRAFVEEFWTPTSSYVNPLIDKVHGIEGLTRLILDYPVLFPDMEIRRVGEPDAVDAYTRYPWRLSSSARIRMLGRDFGHVLEGTDIIAFNDDGAIKTVVSFFGSTTG